VAVMTNCDTVKLYQNSQTVRVAHASEFTDGMVHFYLPYIPGILRAEGYRGGLLVCEDILRSDHEAEILKVETDKAAMNADGASVAMIDLILEDKYERRYMLENRNVSVRAKGAPVTILMDNGNAWSEKPFVTDEGEMFNGHMLIVVKAGLEKGEAEIEIDVQGFEKKYVRIALD